MTMVSRGQSRRTEALWGMYYHKEQTSKTVCLLHSDYAFMHINHLKSKGLTEAVCHDGLYDYCSVGLDIGFHL